MSFYLSAKSESSESTKLSVSPRISMLFDPDVINHLAKVSAEARENDEIVRPKESDLIAESIIRAEIENKITVYNQMNNFQIYLFKVSYNRPNLDVLIISYLFSAHMINQRLIHPTHP